jgi:long-chain acyl-CoA synthetase
VWSGWLSDEDAQAWVTDEQQAWGITSSDVHLVCGPLSHSAPLRFALMTLWAGGSVLVPAKFDAATVAGLLPSVTTTFMAPTHLQRLMEYAGDSALEHNLRLMAHAGAACPDRVRLWAYETFGTDVVTEFYGSTEGQFTTCTADEWRARPGTVGRARPGRAMRVDNEGRLWAKAPKYARFEYWGDEEKTASAWDGEWFTVGDYGRIDEDGYVYLEGRKGDLIITGGVNVYPAEIERVLANLPGVEHVVVFALPDDHWGQRVCVAIVGSVSEEQVRNFARNQLSGPKRPKSVFIVDSLPQTHSGKVNRSAVPSLFS